MAEITIPMSVATEPLIQGGRDFPAGVWQGEIDQVRSNTFPDWAGSPTNNGYANPEGETLSIQIGSAQALEEGQEEAGNMKAFAPSNRENYVIRDGDLAVWDVDPDERDVAYWRLQRAHRALCQLAVALGAASRNGAGFSVDLEAFVGGLSDGAYDGQPISFVTTHRPYKTKDGSEKVEVQVSQFLAAG